MRSLTKLGGVLAASLMAAWPAPLPSAEEPDWREFGVEARTDHIPVSLIYLIANPTALNGKRVRVKGVLRFQFEGDRLFLDHDSYKNVIDGNAVRLGFDLGSEDRSLGDFDRHLEKELSGRVVTVEGTYWGSKPKAPCPGEKCIVIRSGPSGIIKDLTFLLVQPAREDL